MALTRPMKVDRRLHPRKYHVIFPWTRPAVIKYVYLRVLPKVWAIHLAKALDTMGFVIVVLCQHQNLFNCISHQAAVPLILDLIECRLVYMFERPNNKAELLQTSPIFKSEVWNVWPQVPNQSCGKTEGSLPCKRSIIKVKMARVEAFQKALSILSTISQSHAKSPNSSHWSHFCIFQW